MAFQLDDLLPTVVLADSLLVIFKTLYKCFLSAAVYLLLLKHETQNRAIPPLAFF